MKAKKEKEAPIVRQGMPTSGIAGVLLLFVCVSIGYANYVVFFGTDGLIPHLMLIPSTLFVGAFLFYKAIK